MPKNLNKKWALTLGDEYKKIHYKYCDNLGNLTLVTYNAQKSNKLYKEKLTMNDGFKDDDLYLNKIICKYDYWNEETILKRLKNLTEICLKIWPVPKY